MGDSRKVESEVTDDEFIEAGLYIEDIDLGKIPLLSPEDNKEIRRRKRKIILERLRHIAKAWNLRDEKKSVKVLMKIIYDVSREVSKQIEERRMRLKRFAEVTAKRLRN